jgi:protein-S-isoprenylcysteine O-methyltransferase Ste14
MEQFSNALAVIGVYFALMAVLAVMVEAVISWLKIPSWSPLQGKPSPNDVLGEVAGWLPREQAELMKGRVMALNKALAEIGEAQLPLDEMPTVDKLVERIGEATTKHIKKERNRRAIIRLVAILLGMGFAALFRIDTLQLLAPIFEPAKELGLKALDPTWAQVVGLVLSGFAASAGSSFWHDQSARLRSLKAASEAVGGVAGTS